MTPGAPSGSGPWPFDGTVAVDVEAWQQALPPPPPPEKTQALRERLARLVAQDARKVVVLDDDPTGTQTVHGVDVLTTWDEPHLEQALAGPDRLFFLLTNSRSLPPAQAAALAGHVVTRLCRAAQRTGAEFVVVSRSDSTLRGHFPVETDAVAEALARDGRPVDAVVLAPFFEEGGRLTAFDVHWVRQAGQMVPAAQTEFARDHAFAYTQSRLPAWVEEKTGGRIRSGDVFSISLEALRSGNLEAVVEALIQSRAPVVAINAAGYPDLTAAALALMEAERRGRRYLYRTAASYVRVRAGIEPRPLLRPGELVGPPESGRPAGGLVVVGSYVQRTTRQLERLLALPGVRGVELEVSGLLSDGPTRLRVIERVAAAVDEAVRGGQDVAVFTSREVRTLPGEEGLRTGALVAGALVEALRAVETRPAYLVAKGGITSSRLAVEALGVRRARVEGQAAPGVPVWRLGPESRFPGLAYVIFPGNVGDDETLAELVGALAEARRAGQ